MFLGLLKTTNRRRECLIFKYPTSPDRCNVFLKIKDADGSIVASCIRCRGIHRYLSKDEQTEHQKAATIPVVNGTCFGSDPALATHLPGCEPSSFHAVMERFNSAVSKSPSRISDESDSSISYVDKAREPSSKNEDVDAAVQSRSQPSHSSDSSLSKGENVYCTPSMDKDEDGLGPHKPAAIDVSKAPSPTSEQLASAILGIVKDDHCDQPAVKRDKETRPETEIVRFNSNSIAQFAKSPTPTSCQLDSSLSGSDDDCEISATNDQDIQSKANTIASPWFPTSEEKTSPHSGRNKDDCCKHPSVNKDEGAPTCSPTPSDMAKSTFPPFGIAEDEECEIATMTNEEICSDTKPTVSVIRSLATSTRLPKLERSPTGVDEDEASAERPPIVTRSSASSRSAFAETADVDCERTPLEKDIKTRVDPTRIGDATPDYPVEMCMLARNPRNPMLLFKFTDANNDMKCYKFRVMSTRLLNMDFMTVCSSCGSVRERIRIKSLNQRSTVPVHLKTIRTNGSRMFSDPRANHVYGCVPYDYDEVIKKYPLVTDEVREKIIKGEDISMHLSPPGSLFSSNPDPLEQYPVSIAMNANKLTNPLFIYRLIGEPDKCYKFICKRHYTSHGTFSIVCSRCDLIYYEEKRRCGAYPSRPFKLTDGRAMFTDPNSGHLPGCIPLDYNECLKKTPLVSDLVAKKIIERKDNSAYLPRKSLLSLRNDDLKSKVSSTSTVSRSIGAPPQQNYSKRGRKLMKRKSYGLERDSEDDSDRLTCEMKRGSQEGCDKKPATALSPSAKKRHSSAMSVPSPFKPDDGVSRDESQHLDSDGNSQPSADMHRDSLLLSMDVRNDTSPVFDDDTVKNDVPAASDIAVSLPSSLSPDHTKCTTVKRIRIAPTTTFVRTFGAMAVNEADTEVDLSVLDGRRLRVVIERKVFPISENRSFLTHELTLPENVDIDSLMCSWNEGSLVVRADLKKIPIVLDS